MGWPVFGLPPWKKFSAADRDHLVPPRWMDAAVCRAEVCYPFGREHELGPKRLGLLRELLPKPGTIAFVTNANNPFMPFQIHEMQAAAQAVGQPLLVVSVGTEDEVDQAFATMAERNVT